MSDFNKSIELHAASSSSKDYYLRGKIYLSKKIFDKAIADYDKAIEMDLKNVSAYCDRGWAYQETGDLKQALEATP